ncbi:MAG: NTP transferase domain-containing protein, partial [Candidatus Omnitrophota bacterium]|nr:NTP transferase domain-containing protein [Candidatus Omnitrophota bacterium]
MKNTACIILAAGRGIRMKSLLPKILHKLSGKTMIERVLELIKPFSFRPIVVVTGYKGSSVAKFCEGAKTVTQKNLLGSGDAVMTARAALSRFKGDVVVLYGDTPLIQQTTLDEL